MNRSVPLSWLVVLALGATQLIAPGVAQGQPKPPPPPPPIPGLTTPTRLWTPGKKIKVLIENPDQGDDFLNLSLFNTVKHEFDRWTEYQSSRWGVRGLSFEFITTGPGEIPPKGSTPDITVKWVETLPGGDLGGASSIGTRDGNVPDQNGRRTVPQYKNVSSTISLALGPHRVTNPFDPNKTSIDENALAQTIQHEIGHTEGLPHSGVGVMRAGNDPSRQGEPKSPSDIVSQGDKGVDAAKSAVIGTAANAVDPPKPVDFSGAINNLEITPTVFYSPGDDRYEYSYTFGSDPNADDSFYQFGIFFGVEPVSVFAPTGWKWLFEPLEPDTDFLLNGEVYDSWPGGWMRFWTEDPKTVGPGESITFDFVSQLGPADLGLGDVYGVTLNGDAQFLSVRPTPEPGTLGLIVLGLGAIAVGRRRRSHTRTRT